MYMRVAVFIVFIVLYFYEESTVYAQSTDTGAVIDFSATDFSFERPFTISLLLRDSDTRPTVTFPGIPGLTKQGISTSTTRTEVDGREVVSQFITQTYLATRPGTIRIPPFTLTAGGQAVRSAGVTLTVRGPASPADVAAAAATKARTDKRAAFLQTSVSQTSVYTGEGLQIRLSFFVAETYPFEVKFGQLEEQVAAITRRLKPLNAWEENDNITELTPQSVVLNGRRYVEYRIYQATFFVLATRVGTTRQITLPAVPLTVNRRLVGSPVASPASASGTAGRAGVPGSPAQTEAVTFMSQPVTVQVRPLPRVAGARLGQTAVGTFRLVEDADRGRLAVGQSVRYDFRIEGRGNIAGIQPPQAVVAGLEADVFPPQIQGQTGRTANEVSGYKLFRYFLIPRQKGMLALADRFFWVYFDPQSGRYDTLRPQLRLRVGEATDDGPTAGIVPPDTLNGTGRPSIYAGLDQTDSTAESIDWLVVVQTVANVLIVLMILGTLAVFARK